MQLEVCGLTVLYVEIISPVQRVPQENLTSGKDGLILSELEPLQDKECCLLEIETPSFEKEEIFWKQR